MSNTEKRIATNGDETDAYDHWRRRRVALTPRDPDKPWQMNRKSFKEVKRRTHKRERQQHRLAMMS